MKRFTLCAGAKGDNDMLKLGLRSHHAKLDNARPILN
jgi:hypothetical protein